MDESRIIDLETKISHLEFAVETLQQTVFEQQRAIDKLQESLTRRLEKCEFLAAGGADIGPANERPPHY